MALYLITGIAGFIGSSLARAIVAQGDQVRGVDNFATGKRENIQGILDRIDFREADILDLDVMHKACACKAPAERAAGQVFNIATGGRVMLNEMFTLLQGLTSYKVEPEYGPERGGDIKHSLADISKAETALGYKTVVNFEEGSHRTVEWYRGK